MLSIGHPIELTWFIVNLTGLMYAIGEIKQSRKDYLAQSDELSKDLAYDNMRRDATRVLALVTFLIAVVMVLILKPDGREPLTSQALIVRCSVLFVVMLMTFDSFMDARARVNLKAKDRRRQDLGRAARRNAPKEPSRDEEGDSRRNEESGGRRQRDE